MYDVESNLVIPKLNHVQIFHFLSTLSVYFFSIRNIAKLMMCPNFSDPLPYGQQPSFKHLQLVEQSKAPKRKIQYVTFG